MMSHFGPSDWVDFTRGLLPDQESAEIRSHLEQRCDECVESIAFWKRVLEAMAPEESYQVPNRVLEKLAAEYTEQKPWRWLVEFARWAELVFDSFSQLEVVLVRGLGPNLAPMSRQLIHEAEPFVIDLRVESDTSRNRLCVTGQILNSQTPTETVPRARVILLNGSDLVVANTTANISGEFDLECEIASDLRLFINISGQRAIGITLPPVHS